MMPACDLTLTDRGGVYPIERWDVRQDLIGPLNGERSGVKVGIYLRPKLIPAVGGQESTQPLSDQ